MMFGKDKRRVAHVQNGTPFLKTILKGGGAHYMFISAKTAGKPYLP